MSAPVNYAALRKLTDDFRFPVIIVDPAMPPGYIEMRSGAQRVGVWLDGTANHDPGDEDRSAR